MSTSFQKAGLQVADRKLLPLIIAESNGKILIRCKESSSFLSLFASTRNVSTPLCSEVRGIIETDGSGELAVVASNGVILQEGLTLSSDEVQKHFSDKLVLQTVC